MSINILHAFFVMKANNVWKSKKAKESVIFSLYD